MDTTETTYEEALSDKKIQSLIDKIHALPSGDEYAEHVENRFRTEVLGTSGSHDGVNYIQFSELPNRTQQIIGYTENGSLPWWLKEFNWGFEHSNAEHITPENLEKLNSSNPERTEIRSPTLGESNIQTALDSVSDIGEFLSEQWGIEPDSDPDQLSLPDNLFNLAQTNQADDGNMVIQASGEYESFFNDVVSLCPPFNPVLQTISMVISGVDKRYYQLLPGSVEERVRELEIESRFGSNGGRDLFDPLLQLYAIDTEFGVEIEVENAQELLDPLEQLQYKAWGQGQREHEHITDLIRMACNRSSEITEIDSIAKSLLVSPVYLTKGSNPTLLTMKRKKHGYGYGNMYYHRDQEEKALAIAEVLGIDTEEIDDW